MIELVNNHWQVGILPEQGGSVAHARFRYSGAWLDLIRPMTAGGSPGSFLMMPWANRIRDGLLRYGGASWQLDTPTDDGTARHGDTRKRRWTVEQQTTTSVTLGFQSVDFADFNFPFRFDATLTYSLDDNEMTWTVGVVSKERQTFPIGFGFHPYFQRHSPDMPRLEVPCDKYFVLTDAMAAAAAVPVPPELDFRQARRVSDEMVLDDLLTHRDISKPIRLTYSEWQTELQIWSDDIFQHVVVYTAPDGTLAVEPQTNANDGFNLLAKGVPGHGVIELEPEAQVKGSVRLRLVSL